MPTRQIAVPAALLTTLLAVLLSACGTDTGGEQASGSPESGTSESGAAGPTTTCDYPGSGEAAAEASPPPDEAPSSGEVSVTLTTDAGEIGATLDRAAAPCTVGSFTSLAEQGYFDGTPCHRLTTQGIFVLQCGDPTGTGTGGPGYSFADELSGQETYPAGTLAMANSGPDTNGSQFFLVYEATELPPLYTVFGTLDEPGLGVVRSVAADGVEGGAGDGAPATPVTIESVTRE